MLKLSKRSLLTLASPALLFACNGDDNSAEYQFEGGEFSIKFQAMVGDEDFSCDKKYDDLGSKGSEAEIQDFRFYISNLRLVTTDGDEVPIEIVEDAPFQSPDVALVDFEDATGACATSGSRATHKSVRVSAPEGRYRGLRLSTSVPEELNHEDPTTNPEPLQVTAMQWNWLLGYKFIRAELKPISNMADMKEMQQMHGVGGMGGAPPAEHAMDSQFHMGSLGCVVEDGEKTPADSCKKPNRNEVYLEEFHPGRQVIIADIKEIFSEVDLGGMNHCHGSPNDVCISSYESAGVDYESGDILDSQTIFRIEDKN